ncbi:hypothetical protein COOONC_03516 [Cooperia oncophora]
MHNQLQTSYFSCRELLLKGIKNTVASAADQIGDVLEQAEHKAEESANNGLADSGKGAYDDHQRREKRELR